MLDLKTDDIPTNLVDLQMLVSSNKDALQLAREGLQKQCRVRDYSPYTVLPDIWGMQSLASAFKAEGELAEMQGHANEAATSYLDIVHLANESCRGGIFFDGLNEKIIEGWGTDSLRRLVPQLDAKTCRHTAATLETLDLQRQTSDDIIAHEWSHRTYTSIKDEYERLVHYKDNKAMMQDFKMDWIRQQTLTRHLIIDLAARAYALEKGHAPAIAADLVPDYLKVILQDPLTGTNMVYLP